MTKAGDGHPNDQCLPYPVDWTGEYAFATGPFYLRSARVRGGRRRGS